MKPRETMPGHARQSDDRCRVKLAISAPIRLHVSTGTGNTAWKVRLRLAVALQREAVGRRTDGLRSTVITCSRWLITWAARLEKVIMPGLTRRRWPKAGRDRQDRYPGRDHVPVPGPSHRYGLLDIEHTPKKRILLGITMPTMIASK